MSEVNEGRNEMNEGQNEMNDGREKGKGKKTKKEARGRGKHTPCLHGDGHLHDEIIVGGLAPPLPVVPALKRGATGRGEGGYR